LRFGRGRARIKAVRYRVVLGLLLASLVANTIFAVLWVGVDRRPTVYRLVPAGGTVPYTNVLRPIRTNLVVQPHLLSWRDIESEDYLAYIRNLRAIGCPEATVRDIIVADVNA
jgi:hypothetical protein